jgi:hypothetical protein
MPWAGEGFIIATLAALVIHNIYLHWKVDSTVAKICDEIQYAHEEEPSDA